MYFFLYPHNSRLKKTLLIVHFTAVDSSPYSIYIQRHKCLLGITVQILVTQMSQSIGSNLVCFFQKQLIFWDFSPHSHSCVYREWSKQTKREKKSPQKGNIQQPLVATQPWYAEDHPGMNNPSNFEADWLQQQRTTQGATAVS